MSISWAVAEKQYKLGTLESNHPRIKEALDKASFNKTKVTLLVLFSLAFLGAFITSTSLDKAHYLPFLRIVILPTLCIGFVGMMTILFTVAYQRDKIEKDKHVHDQPYLQKLLAEEDTRSKKLTENNL